MISKSTVHYLLRCVRTREYWIRRARMNKRSRRWGPAARTDMVRMCVGFAHDANRQIVRNLRIYS